MDLAASRLVASGAELSQQAARVAAAHPALRGASAAELCLLQVLTAALVCAHVELQKRAAWRFASSCMPGYVRDWVV